MAWCVTEVK